MDQLPVFKLKNQAARALDYLRAPPADCFTDVNIQFVEGEKGKSQEPEHLAVRLNAKINGTKIELVNLSHQWRLLVRNTHWQSQTLTHRCHYLQNK